MRLERPSTGKCRRCMITASILTHPQHSSSLARFSQLGEWAGTWRGRVIGATMLRDYSPWVLTYVEDMGILRALAQSCSWYTRHLWYMAALGEVREWSVIPQVVVFWSILSHGGLLFDTVRGTLPDSQHWIICSIVPRYKKCRLLENW